MTTIHVRHPLRIDLHALLLHHPTPTIDLGIQSYDDSTRNFLEAVTEYKHRAMTATPGAGEKADPRQDGRGGERDGAV
jgi:hypothetical protein